VSAGEESTASRIEKLHELSALGLAELEGRYGENLKAWLLDFVSTELPGSPMPPVGSSKDLSEAINQLARNKRAWSQRLGSLVIEQSDSQTPAAEEQASAGLKEFIQQCPWKYLRDSASHKL